MQQDKTTRFSGEFGGAPATDRCHFGRGQPRRPPYSALPPSPRDTLVRPYFIAKPESSYRPPAFQGSSGGYSGNQGSSSSHSSAMPESSYRPLAIQGSSSGYSGYQGLASRQQCIVPWGCYECGDLGHINRFCPDFGARRYSRVTSL